MRDDIIREYVIGNMTIWLLLLRKVSEAEFEKMYVLCSRERREKADRIKSGIKRKQSIGAGYLLFLLKRRFSIQEEPVILPTGKPVFQECEAVHFSISHSEETVALAFGDKPLGVDIEHIKSVNLRLAKRFFTREEYGSLSECGEEEQEDLFYRIWTGKEAVVKAVGCGLVLPLNGFSVLEKQVSADGNIYELHQQRYIEGETELSGERYELYRQKFAAEKQSAWVSVAQLITDSL